MRLRDSSPSVSPAAVLRDRERGIVALIVEGLTNQQIADRLGLARLTVSGYIANMLWRLGLTGRHEIAAWAIAQERREARR